MLELHPRSTRSLPDRAELFLTGDKCRILSKGIICQNSSKNKESIAPWPFGDLNPSGCWLGLDMISPSLEEGCKSEKPEKCNFLLAQHDDFLAVELYFI